MMIHPKTRDLARRLLEYEAMAAESSESAECVTLRVYEKLRQSLVPFAGIAAFESLASRALALATPESPSLGSAQITADGSIRSLGEYKPQIDNDKNRTGDDQADERGVILIARLLGLLLIFLGEALTLSLLRVHWPSDVFDDHSSGIRRKV
jgi:hypothetical protein